MEISRVERPGGAVGDASSFTAQATSFVRRARLAIARYPSSAKTRSSTNPRTTLCHRSPENVDGWRRKPRWGRCRVRRKRRGCYAAPPRLTSIREGPGAKTVEATLEAWARHVARVAQVPGGLDRAALGGLRADRLAFPPRQRCRRWCRRWRDRALCATEVGGRARCSPRCRPPPRWGQRRGRGSRPLLRAVLLPSDRAGCGLTPPPQALPHAHAELHFEGVEVAVLQGDLGYDSYLFFHGACMACWASAQRVATAEQEALFVTSRAGVPKERRGRTWPWRALEQTRALLRAGAVGRRWTRRSGSAGDKRSCRWWQGPLRADGAPRGGRAGSGHQRVRAQRGHRGRDAAVGAAAAASTGSPGAAAD